MIGFILFVVFIILYLAVVAWFNNYLDRDQQAAVDKSFRQHNIHRLEHELGFDVDYRTSCYRCVEKGRADLIAKLNTKDNNWHIEVK